MNMENLFPNLVIVRLFIKLHEVNIFKNKLEKTVRECFYMSVIVT